MTRPGFLALLLLLFFHPDSRAQVESAPPMDQEKIRENVDMSDLESQRDLPAHWRKAILESGLFIVLMNGKRAALEPWTQAGIKGPFFKPKFPRAVNVSIGFSAGSRVRV